MLVKQGSVRVPVPFLADPARESLMHRGVPIHRFRRAEPQAGFCTGLLTGQKLGALGRAVQRRVGGNKICR